MDSILQQITDWLKEMLVSAIMGNLSGMFESVNNQVGEIATSVGMTPANFSPGVFAMVRNISESVIIPIAGLILTFIACYELIQMIIDHNNLANFETWIFFKWVFKTFDDPLRKPHFLRFYRIELLATAFLLLRQNQKLKEGWRLSAKLDRIGADLEKARKKRAEWDAKVKDLERRYREEENSEIHEMVHAANLNPEQLSELLRMFAADMAPKPDTINTMNEEETQNEI